MFLRIPKISCVLLLAGVLGCSPDPGQPPQLMVFAAASLRDVMTEVGSRFEQQHGIHINYNFAGSTVLARQLLAAPRADLFISANRAWMRRLEQAGRIVFESHQLVLGNRLVVIVNHASALEGHPRELFCTPVFEHLSIGNPEAVPAGIYAREWLEKLPCDGGSAWDALAGRIAPAPVSVGYTRLSLCGQCMSFAELLGGLGLALLRLRHQSLGGNSTLTGPYGVPVGLLDADDLTG